MLSGRRVLQNAHEMFWKVRRDRQRLDADRSRGLSPAYGLALALGIVLGMLSGGYLQFLAGIPRAALRAPGPVDAIVVLTGGTERLEGGLELLAEGRAQRLLVSGVHPETSAEDLARRGGGDHAARFACCIDLDTVSTSTRGNAEETAAWMRARGYRGLILVTAAYHMPRSLLELAHAMPEVAIYPHPVYPEGLDLAAWWRRPGTFRLLVTEYVKYGAALVRLRLLAPAS